jgi:hypothetical protein
MLGRSGSSDAKQKETRPEKRVEATSRKQAALFTVGI